MNTFAPGRTVSLSLKVAAVGKRGQILSPEEAVQRLTKPEDQTKCHLFTGASEKSAAALDAVLRGSNWQYTNRESPMCAPLPSSLLPVIV